MLVLFDHSTPAPLTSYLIGHTVTEARDRGWDRLSNRDLLAEAELAGFDVLLTADKNITPSAEPQRPQNSHRSAEHSAMAGRSIAQRKNCSGGKRRHTGHLYRGEHIPQNLTFQNGSGKVANVEALQVSRKGEPP